jgi:YbbR domain-containing protein
MLALLTRNLPLKVLSVLLAFAVWVAMTGESAIVQDLRVPLDIALPANLVPGESPPRTVSVRLRGPESLLRRLDPLPLEVHVDLRDAVQGPRNVQITPDAVGGVPAGIEVALIEPERFRIQLDRRARKSLPVVPAFLGQPPPGYAVYDVRVEPESVEVEGPETHVAALGRLRTDPIHLEGHSESFTVTTSAVPTSPEVRLLDTRPIEAQVEIDRAAGSRVYDTVAVVLAGQVFEARATPAAIAVTLSGPPFLLTRLRPDQLRAVADIHALEPRTEAYEVPLRVELLGVDARDLARVTVKALSRPRVAVVVSRRRIAR